MCEKSRVVAAAPFCGCLGNLGRQRHPQALEDGAGQAGECVVALAASRSLAGEVQAREHRRGASVPGAEQPGGPGVAAHADLLVRGGLARIGADLDPTDHVFSGQAVVDAGLHVHTGDDSVGDTRGAAALDDLVAELGVTDFLGCDAQLHHRGVDAAALDRRDRAVPGGAEVRADQGAQAVVGYSVVVVGTGLDHRVPELAHIALQYVPVAERVRGAVVLVVHDEAEGPGRDGWMRDADPRHHRIHARGARVGVGLGDHEVGGCELSFEHVGGDVEGPDGDPFGKRFGAGHFQLLRCELATHRELDAHLIGDNSVHHLVADTHRRDVRVGQITGAVGAEERAQSLGRRVRSHATQRFSDCWRGSGA